MFMFILTFFSVFLFFQSDCYVAVSGLPDPRKDHAVVMARFARDCISEHVALTKELALSLGPDTADLKIRVGLHSGPITAGVLRGERSRFQLFGDTVNTGARLETSGEGNKIHVSETTATLIQEAGHDNWVRQREDFVHLKGKGAMKTFWVNPRTSTRRSGIFNKSPEMSSTTPRADPNLKTQRLISWNVGTYSKICARIN
jgi:class 3 adenylate cyclase